MIINKITNGFVVQRWDTEKQCFVSQEFVASEDAEWEYENPNQRNKVDPWEAAVDSNNDTNQEPEFPLKMVQPSDV